MQESIGKMFFFERRRMPLVRSMYVQSSGRQKHKTFVRWPTGVFTGVVPTIRRFFAVFYPKKTSLRSDSVKGPIVIAAGGTGGHFFPAEALAAALMERGERVVLLTDGRSSVGNSPVFREVHVVPGAGVAGRSFRRALHGAREIAKGVLAARQILEDLRPSVVVGFGGYPTVAPVLAARLLWPRPVVVLHDQNAMLGKANRFLARLADGIALSFGMTERVPPGCATMLTGNPVRPAISAREKAEYAGPADEIRVLVLGGSLGARVFATLIPEALALLPEAMRQRFRLSMQCPEAVIKDAQSALAQAGVRAELAVFFLDVAGLMADAHLVVARAGGSTVAELAVVGRPAVLIPLTINDDQRANAAALEWAGAAVVVDQDAGASALAAVMERLLSRPEELARMAQAAGLMGMAHAAERLAQFVLAAVPA